MKWHIDKKNYGKFLYIDKVAYSLNGKLTKWNFYKMAQWHNCILAKWPMTYSWNGILLKKHIDEMAHEGTANWLNGTMTKRQVHKMGHRQNGTLTKWNVDKMAHWQNGTLIKWCID